jgi:uncharacterized protein
MSKWYKNGLAFSCQGCGHCCSGPGEGYIWVNQREIEDIADFLKTPANELKRKYTYRQGIRYSLIEKKPGNDCIFLTRNRDGSKGCEIYPVRPAQCRTWPFWGQNLHSRETWSEVCRTCPGIDQGQWYDFDTIEEIRKGNTNIKVPPLTVEQATSQWIERNLSNTDCIEAIKELYGTIDQHLAAAQPQCDNCGRCCDFNNYGHRLYVTTMEMLYLRAGLSEGKVSITKKSSARYPLTRCPYQQKEGCQAHAFRPTGCRIFFCHSLDRQFQNELTERILSRLRMLHQQFNVPYYYADMLTWLQNK